MKTHRIQQLVSQMIRDDMRVASLGVSAMLVMAILYSATIM